MTHTRYRQDALAELHGIEGTIASNRRSAMNTANKRTAEIADAVLPSLQRKAEALRAEAAALPERPPHDFTSRRGDFPCLTRTTPLTEAELAEIAIPAFLQRS